MAEETSTRNMLKRLFESADLSMSERDLHIVSQLHDTFGGQRSKLAGAARQETEPMIIPAFDRKLHGSEAGDERNS